MTTIFNQPQTPLSQMQRPSTPLQYGENPADQVPPVGTPATPPSHAEDNPADVFRLDGREFEHLQVLVKESTVIGGRAGNVVVECTLEAANNPRGLAGAIELFQGTAARRLATAYASTKGLGKPTASLLEQNAPYPVDRLGQPSGVGQVYRYRLDVPVTGGIAG